MTIFTSLYGKSTLCCLSLNANRTQIKACEQFEKEVKQLGTREDVILISNFIKSNYQKKLQLWKLTLKQIQLLGIQQKVLARAIWHLEEKMNLRAAYSILQFQGLFQF